jgi:outer membrane protein assembly factor BamE
MRIGLILLSILLSSCSYLHVPVLAPYKMDIRQGNYVTPEMREKLRPGMTRAQVRYVLGTPMINDAFHGNRWDYVYRLAQQGAVVETQHLALYFENDRLVRAEEGGKPVQMEQPTDAVPEAAKSEPVAVIAEPPPTAQPDPTAEVLNSVQAWATAWSSKNARDYLAAYTPSYKPQDMSREAWEKQRLERISKPKKIEVTLSGVNISMQDAAHATATFKQDYRSDAYRDTTRKTLQFEQVGGVWLIVAERAVP